MIYLVEVLEKYNFIVSREERNAIDAFLNSTACEYSHYPEKPRKRSCGIPQGTSISLFLANIACWELDRKLERLGVGFCRYADDSVIWSTEYDRVVKAYYLIDDCSRKMGVPINLIKSHGIHLLNRPHGTTEIKSKLHIDYLGYSISLNCIAISGKRLREIKGRISYLVYQNLLQALTRKKIFNKARIAGSLDLDFLVTIAQIRHYLYGGLTEEKLRNYIAGKIPYLRFRGVMSYYPLVNDIEQLAKLDGWLEYVLMQSLKLRQKLWREQGVESLPGPATDWISQIGHLKHGVLAGGKTVDLSLPRFTLINSAMRIAINKQGLQGVANPQSSLYY